jgi:hypothetical protein
MATLPEEQPAQRWLTIAIAYAVFMFGRSVLRHGAVLIGFSASSLPAVFEVVLLVAALAGVVGAFGVLGSKRWSVWCAVGGGVVLALCYLFAGAPWFILPLLLIAPLVLATAVRPQWRYMD